MTYRSEASDQYFDLKERARKLSKTSHSIAYALMKCGFCFGAGSVSAVTFHNIDGGLVKSILRPLDLLPCVCTVGWPNYGQGDNYDG